MSRRFVFVARLLIVIVFSMSFIALSTTALAAGPDVSGTTWIGWTDHGKSTATGVYARGGKAQDYQIYSVVFIYDSSNPVPGTSSGFVNGHKILGIGIRNNSNTTGSPTIKLDPDNNSYAPSPDGIANGQSSFSGNGDLGDPIVNTSGGNPIEITIRSANPYNSANDYYCPSGGNWCLGLGQPGFRGSNPGTGVWKVFFDLDQMTAEFGPGGTRNILGKPTLDANAFGTTITFVTASGTEAVVQNRSLSVDPLPPPAPPAPTSLFGPINGTTIDTQTPTLSWSNSSGATSYNIQILNGANVVNSGSSATTSYTPSALPRDVTYTWKVQACNAGGCSAWSYTKTFTVSIGPSGLVSPVNTATNVSKTPTLTWSEVTGAAYYRVQVIQGPLVVRSAKLDGSTSTSWTVTPALPSGTYTWKVRACSATSCANWTAPWTFTTVP